MCTKSLKKLENLVQNNSQFANTLIEVIQNADAIDETLGMILPGINFEGLGQDQISDVLYQLESVRKMIRSSQKTVK